MSDIVSKIFSSLLGIISDPKRAIIIILIILVFPLNLLDYLILIIVNFIIIILNTILWGLVVLVNIIIWVVNEIFINELCEAIRGVLPGMSCPDNIDLWDYTKFRLEYVYINVFGTSTSLLSIILGMFGLSFPIW